MSTVAQTRQMVGSPLDATQGDAAIGAPTYSQASHGFAVGDVIRQSAAATWTKAQADSPGNVGVGLSLVIDVPTSGSFQCWHRNASHEVTLTSHGFGAFGTKLYLSQGTAGALTATAPTTGIILYCGYVVDANTIRWEPGTLV